MKNGLFRSNSMKWWMVLSLACSPVSDFFLSFMLCISSSWIRLKMNFTGRSGSASLRQQTEIFMPLLFISRERLICFQKCLKFIYAPKKTISSAWSNVCSITRLECMRISQHIFWKWPFRMSNDGGHNITLHLTHIHEPRGGVTGVYFSALCPKWMVLNKHLVPGIPSTGGATWTATLTSIQWKARFPPTTCWTEKPSRSTTSPS